MGNMPHAKNFKLIGKQNALVKKNIYVSDAGMFLRTIKRALASSQLKI